MIENLFCDQNLYASVPCCRYAEAETALIRKSVIMGCRSGDAKSIKLFFDLQNALVGPADSISTEDRALLAEAVRLFGEKDGSKNG